MLEVDWLLRLEMSETGHPLCSIVYTVTVHPAINPAFRAGSPQSSQRTSLESPMLTVRPKLSLTQAKTCSAPADRPVAKQNSRRFLCSPRLTIIVYLIRPKASGLI